MMSGYNDQARVESERLAHRHRAPDPVASRGIGAGRDHAAFIRSAADCKGFTAQFGIARFFHGTEKGIKVKMENRSRHSSIINLVINAILNIRSSKVILDLKEPLQLSERLCELETRGECHEITDKNHFDHVVVRAGDVFDAGVDIAVPGFRGSVLSGAVYSRCDCAGWQ
jgi:hypothetical protein